MRKSIIATVLIVSVLLNLTAAFAANFFVSDKAIEDIDTVFYLEGDSIRLETADSSTKVKHVPKGKYSGFEDIDIILEGSVADKFTLVFGINDYPDMVAEMILAGSPKINQYVEWISVNTITCKAVSEYGDLYTSDSRGVSVATRNSGIRTLIHATEFVQSAGITIQFLSIGKVDIYTVLSLRLTGVDGSSQEYRILCQNKSLIPEDTSLVDDAFLNEDSGFYEINTPASKFAEGKIITSAETNAMRDSGNKYTIYMNGVTIFVNNISKATVDKGALTLKNNVIANEILLSVYQDVAGGSIVTLDIQDGFMSDHITYAIDLNGKAVIGMPISEQSKWTDGKKIYCYIVDLDKLKILEESGDTTGVIDNGKMLPCEILDEKIYVNTNPTVFDPEDEMMMFTLKEIDLSGIGNGIPFYTATFDTKGGSSVAPQLVYSGLKIIRPADPYKASFRFAGWYKNETLDIPFDFNTEITSDTTIYAGWISDVHTVTFNSNGGSYADTLIINNGDVIYPVPISKKEGYRFIGWFTDQSLLTEYDFKSGVTGNMDLYAGWEAKAYTLSFYNSHDELYGTQSVSYGDIAIRPVEPQREGYIFDGWYTDKSFEKVFDFNIGIVTDVSVFANWKEIVTDREYKSFDIPVIEEKEGSKAMITFDPEKLKEYLYLQGKGTEITISFEEISNSYTVLLTGQMIRDMKDIDIVLKIQTNEVVYLLPVNELCVNEREFGDANISDIIVEISITMPSFKIIRNVDTRSGIDMVTGPISFEITSTYNGIKITNELFQSYVERILTTSDKVTTGIIIENDKIRHVPTRITDGIAHLKSITNSTYALIYKKVEFTDVKDHGFGDVINEMGSRMIIYGKPDGTFAPDENITKAEFYALIVRALGLPGNSGNIFFSDIDVNDWFYSYAKTASFFKLVEGNSYNEFSPNDFITWEDGINIAALAMTITGLEKRKGLENTLLDIKESLDICIDTNIIDEADAKKLKINMTRAEAAVMIYKLLKNSGLV